MHLLLSSSYDQELEKLAVRKLRISAKTAMSIAEKLYTKGYVERPVHADILHICSLMPGLI